MGVKVFAKAILCIPKVLIRNAGYDTISMINQAMSDGHGDIVPGLDLENGSIFLPNAVGIYDTYSAKKQLVDAR